MVVSFSVERISWWANPEVSKTMFLKAATNSKGISPAFEESGAGPPTAL